jgi:hypothetical protein
VAVSVYVETGSRRVFASALDWPGWSRAARDEQAALENLAGYAQRYAAVAKLAGERLPVIGSADDLEVVERVPGSASTDFGVPGEHSTRDAQKLSDAARQRLGRLVEAAWRYLDDVGANAPAELRKGPRGGGRDRDAIFNHVLGAEAAYARQLGLKLPEPPIDDRAAITQHRQQIIAALTAREPLPGSRWSASYGARRIAWHSLDHAWEIEDRSR